MNKPSLPVPALTVPHQLAMALDAVNMRGMSPAQRNTVLVRLATLLLEGAGVTAQESGDDGR